MNWTIDILSTENILNKHLKRRKVERPPLEEIIKLVEEKGYSETGRMYGVSDNAVRKWIKFGKQYELRDTERS
jgi:transposase-like protein